MKNQLSPPARTIAPPEDVASVKVSKAQTMVLGLHCSPVSATAVALEVWKTRSFWRQIWAVASATEEFGTSQIMSTPSLSIHLRAMLAPISALFWWSANRMSTSKPWSPKSCTAWRAQITEVMPVVSR